MSSTALLQSIQTELELMQSFFFSLQKENEALLSGYSNDDLFDLTELKNQYADQLSAVAAQRDQLLTQLQLPIGKEGLSTAQSQFETLSDPIQALLAIAEQARQLNEENGVLIHAYLDYSTQALEALSQAQPTANEVYDAKGKTLSAGSNKRGIVRA